MYKELITNIFDVISYNKLNGNADLISIESSIMMKPGVYGASNGKIERYDNIDAKVSFKSEEMYDNFIDITTWKKRTMNKTEAYMISKNLSEMYMRGQLQTNALVSKTFQLVGQDSIREDIATILFAITYKLLLECIGQYRIEYNKKDIEILENILLQADELYSPNSQNGKVAVDVVVKYMKLFLDQFVYPFTEVTIASVNNQATDMRIGNIDNLIFKTKQIIMRAAPDVKVMYDYANITNYLINILEQSGILTDLVNTIYKYQYPYRDISGLFGNTIEDKFILRVVTETVDYLKNRITKLGSKGISKSEYENIIKYEKIVERLMDEFVKDPRTRQQFDIRRFYSYDKKVIIITNKPESNINIAINRISELKKAVTDTCNNNIGSDHISEKIEKENNYSDFYISLISKFKLETLRYNGANIIEVRYTEPYINSYKGELEWIR